MKTFLGRFRQVIGGANRGANAADTQSRSASQGDQGKGRDAVVRDRVSQAPHFGDGAQATANQASRIAGRTVNAQGQGNEVHDPTAEDDFPTQGFFLHPLSSEPVFLKDMTHADVIGIVDDVADYFYSVSHGIYQDWGGGASRADILERAGVIASEFDKIQKLTFNLLLAYQGFWTRANPVYADNFDANWAKREDHRAKHYANIIHIFEVVDGPEELRDFFTANQSPQQWNEIAGRMISNRLFYLKEAGKLHDPLVIEGSTDGFPTSNIASQDKGLLRVLDELMIDATKGAVSRVHVSFDENTGEIVIRNDTTGELGEDFNPQDMSAWRNRMGRTKGGFGLEWAHDEVLRLGGRFTIRVDDPNRSVEFRIFMPMA